MLEYIDSWLNTAGVVAGTIVIICGVGLYFFQEKLLYIPTIPGSGGAKNPDDNPAGYRNPGEIGLPYRDVFLTTDDGVKVHGWLIPQGNAMDVPTILFFHGNAGNIGYRLFNADYMYKSLRCNILLMDYRGFGKSEGTPSEEGLKLDAKVFIEEVYRGTSLGVAPKKLILFGRSLGGAVALSSALNHSEKISAVIIENTFLSISHMVDVLMPFLKFFKRFILRIQWDSGIIAADITCPVLLLSGGLDELVPPWHMEILHQLLKNAPTTFYLVPKGKHNDTWLIGGDAYYRKILWFISTLSFKEADSTDRTCEIEMKKNL